MEFCRDNLVKVDMSESGAAVDQLKDTLLSKMKCNTSPKQHISTVLAEGISDCQADKIDQNIMIDKECYTNEEIRDKVAAIYMTICEPYEQAGKDYFKACFDKTWVTKK